MTQTLAPLPGAGSVPATLSLALDIPPDEVLAKLGKAKGVQVVTKMPPASAKRRAFLAWINNGDGFTLMRAPRQIQTPSDEIAETLQRLKVDGVLAETARGSELVLTFRWTVSRTGYISLWPFAIMCVATSATWGWLGPALCSVGLVLVAWPRDVQARRLELVSIVSDVLGAHIVTGELSAPYRG